MIDAAGTEDRATLNIDIRGRDDTPIPRNDISIAFEAGGVNNGTLGTNPTGNVLLNDSDVDGTTERLSVTGFNEGTSIGVLGSGELVDSLMRLDLPADVNIEIKL